MKKIFLNTMATALAALAISLPVQAQDVDALAERVTEFTLDNGMHFIIIERPVAPVATFVTFVNVGSADEPTNNTGVAHIFEHMAFKGSRNIGTGGTGQHGRRLSGMAGRVLQRPA